MPRHFLVKRHKHCAGTVSYRDRLQDGQEGTEKGSYTVIDTDKYNIIREGDYVSDYSGYGSPDSGYAASPNSSHLGFAREKENLSTDRENNNNKNFIKAASVISYYDNINGSMITTGMGSIDRGHYGDNKSSDTDQDDTPIDLSMPSRKKTVLSSVPAYMQQEDSHNQHHIQYQQQQQQQQQVYNCKPSQVAASVTAAQLRLEAFSKFYANNNNSDRSLCAMIPPLSPNSLPFNLTSPRHIPRPILHASLLYPGAIKTDALLETETITSHPNVLQCSENIFVPSAGQRLSSPLPSPLPALATSYETSTINGRLTPLNRPSPLKSPSRKRGISDNTDELADEFYIQDLSKSLPAPKKRDSIDESITTPISKTSSSQKSKTTAPVTKKSPGSVPSGKRLKAVRRLNFDIDTTSPVSGTIIKDAADFHPEDGKVVYGDIEPSFNFVEVTPEARAELDKIDNKIGDYICQLCKEFYEDAFQLAQHRCSRIIHVEYRCPECEKVFNCPANLASHRRWHKPRVSGQNKIATSIVTKNLSNQKIAPKQEFNSNGMTETNTETSLPGSPSPNRYIAGINNAMVNSACESITNDIKRTDSVNVALNGKQSPAFSKTDDIVKLPFMSSNSETKENGFLFSLPQIQTAAEVEIKRPVTKNSLSYPSTVSEDSFIRPETVIALNPLHNTPVTYGSSLTSEERSLVLQVLSSHNRHHQTTTTTTTSTTTVSTPYISDTFSSYNNSTIKSCLGKTDEIHIEDLTHKSIRQETNDSTIFSRSSSSSSSSSSPSLTSSPPLDLTHVKGGHYQHQFEDQRRQTALSEHQANPQIGCPVCGKKFQRQAYLRKHILSQHGKQDNLTKTDQTAGGDITTNDNIVFNGNQATTDSGEQHGNISTSNCSVCGKSFTSDSARIKHESMTHGLTAVLACSTCCMTFASKAALDKHSRYAHASEMYSCKYCSSTFHSSPGLTRHINKCHPTENRRVILLQLPSPRTC